MRAATDNIVLRDRTGRVQTGATGISILRDSDGSTATIYTAKSGATTTTQADLTTDQNGYIICQSTGLPGWLIPDVYDVSATNSPTLHADLSGMGFQIATHSARLAQAHSGALLLKESDTGLIYFDDGTNWQIFKGDGHVVKTADETVNNSAVLQNDDHLFFPIEPNEIWIVRGLWILTGASANADFQFGWTGPTGTTALWGGVSGTGAVWTEVGTGSSPNALRTISQVVTMGGFAGTAAFEVAAVFFADATHGGTINAQWAQNVATAENSTANKGSHLTLRRLA